MDLNFTIGRKMKEVFPTIREFSHVGGGSINECFRILSGSMQYFCKVNSATKFPHLFLNEKQGIELLSRNNIILTPSVVDCFEDDEKQYLLMEWIHSGERSTSFWKIFGEQMAKLHQINESRFGWSHDNYMGSVRQMNRWSSDWTDFFINQRLRPMVSSCRSKGLLSSTQEKDFDQLYKKLGSIFDDAKPCLLHGDLWSGNFMCNENNQPVLIDPAVYFGHRSIDLGMTSLFGGFSSLFYEAYHFHFPLQPNYKEQWQACNLYPLLIHLLLFGRSYLPQVNLILKQFK